MKKDGLELLDAETEGAVIKEAQGSEGLDKILSAAGKSGRAIQLFDPERVISRMHLIGAYANAIRAFKGGTNISKSISMEMLLFAAMTKQIDKAIDGLGAKPDRDFIVFAESASAYGNIGDYVEKAWDFRPARERVIKIAKRSGIITDEYKEIDGLILQKMAVSRLEI